MTQIIHKEKMVFPSIAVKIDKPELPQYGSVMKLEMQNAFVHKDKEYIQVTLWSKCQSVKVWTESNLTYRVLCDL